MKLADWLHTRSTTPEQLRRMLGVRNRSTVRRWLDGSTRPTREMQGRIEALTEGEVTPADFADPAPPLCAEVIINQEGEEEWIFSWSRGGARQRAAFEQMMREPREGSTHSAPLQQAMDLLGGRVRLTPRGVFLLDGRPSDARRVVEAANRELAALGRPLLRYPGVHRREA